MNIKILLNDLVTGNQLFGEKISKFERSIPENFCESEFITRKFSYDIFENGEGLNEIDVIKKYHIGENPIDDDYYWVLGDFDMLSVKFGKYLLYCL